MRLLFEDFCKDESAVYMADLVLTKDDFTEGHCHDFYEFFVVLEGCFLHECDGKKSQLTPGMCKFVRPNDFHRMYAVGELPTHTLRNIAIERTYFEELLEPLKEEVGQKLWEDLALYKHLLGQYIYKTTQMLQDREVQHKRLLTASIIMDLLLHILYQKEETVYIPQWLSELYQTMRGQVAVEEGLEGMLRRTEKSQEHMTRVFKQYYHTTPTAFINSERLQYAARLLTTTKTAVIDIAYQSGFNNMAYFNRKFKEMYQCTPSDYRGRHYKTFY
ncbi:MAG: helix-turn-helix domain-containing protein [Cellulosilyticaceae bacterium]